MCRCLYVSRGLLFCFTSLFVFGKLCLKRKLCTYPRIAKLKFLFQSNHALSIISCIDTTICLLQVHLRRVMHRDRFMRRSSIASAVGNRIWRDLIHNPLHLIFSVDVLGMTSSTLASLSKGFAELSTDGQFLQLRSKQVSFSVYLFKNLWVIMVVKPDSHMGSGLVKENNWGG